MSKLQHKPVRQDYIAKVRYLNTLPPPPLNPKYLHYNTSEPISAKEESEQILSSFFRKQNHVNLIEHIDDEYGLNLNLLNNPGLLNNGDELSIFGFRDKSGVDADTKIELHPRDKALLRDAGIGKISKSEPGVSFLRRTEYISESNAGVHGGSGGSGVSSLHVPQSGGSNGSLGDTIAQKKQDAAQYDAAAQLEAVEATFKLAQESLDNFAQLTHPRKRGRKAVGAWPLIPDTSMMDTKFLSVKFTGLASFTKDQEILERQLKGKYNADYERRLLELAIFKPITSADGEWMSLYQLRGSPDEVQELHARLNSTDREQPVNLLDEDDSLEYKFKHMKNYDMNFQRYAKPYEELSIKFVPGETQGKRKLAQYYPVSGKIELKKHRVSQNTEINRFLDESTTDYIKLKLREPNTDEMRMMDNLRSAFDPMEYEGEDDPEDEPEIEDEQGDKATQKDPANVESSEVEVA